MLKPSTGRLQPSWDVVGVSRALQKPGQGLPLAPLAGHPTKSSEPKAALSPTRGETSQPGAVETSGIASCSPSPSPSRPRPREKPAALCAFGRALCPTRSRDPTSSQGAGGCSHSQGNPSILGSTRAVCNPSLDLHQVAPLLLAEDPAPWQALKRSQAPLLCY